MKVGLDDLFGWAQEVFQSLDIAMTTLQISPFNMVSMPCSDSSERGAFEMQTAGNY